MITLCHSNCKVIFILQKTMSPCTLPEGTIVLHTMWFHNSTGNFSSIMLIISWHTTAILCKHNYEKPSFRIGVPMYSMILVMQASAFASIICNDVRVGDKRGSPMQWGINDPEWHWIGWHTAAQIDQRDTILTIFHTQFKLLSTFD